MGDWIFIVADEATLQSFYGIFGSDGQYFWSGEGAGSWYFAFVEGDWYPWYDDDEPIHGTHTGQPW